MPSYHINGEEPQLVGARCTGFVLQHCFENDRITDQVNVAHLRFGDQWYRLYFECGNIFWRASSAPERAQNADLAYGLLLNDLTCIEGIVGHTVEEVNYEASESGDVAVRVRFSTGKVLTFKYDCNADTTQLGVQP